MSGSKSSGGRLRRSAITGRFITEGYLVERAKLIMAGRSALEASTWPPCVGQDQHDTFAARDIATIVIDAALKLMSDDNYQARHRKELE
jgi:hypothetical protein